MIAARITSGPKATITLRLMAGAVFFWEGLLKFAYAEPCVGRFTKLGMPMPEVLAPAIAVLEIGGGLLLMSDLGTRLISVPFIIIGCWASSETTARTAPADLVARNARNQTPREKEAT